MGVSTIFGVIGLGSSLVLIPLFTMYGIDFNLAKALGLFANGATTVSMTLNNIKKGLVDFKKVAFFAVVSSIFAILGSYSSNYIDKNIVQLLFLAFVFVSMWLLYLGHLSSKHQNSDNYNILNVIFFISIIAYIGGLIGVGGGAVYLPLFIYLGVTMKNSIVFTTALIPVVSFSAFFTYASFIKIDWILLGVVAVAALLGGYFGNTIMHKIKNDKYLKIIITIFLAAISIEMVYKQFTGN